MAIIKTSHWFEISNPNFVKGSVAKIHPRKIKLLIKALKLIKSKRESLSWYLYFSQKFSNLNESNNQDISWFFTKNFQKFSTIFWVDKTTILRIKTLIEFLSKKLFVSRNLLKITCAYALEKIWEIFENFEHWFLGFFKNQRDDTISTVRTGRYGLIRSDTMSTNKYRDKSTYVR